VQQGIIQLTCGYVPQDFKPTPPGIEPPPGDPTPPIIIPGPTPIPILPLPVYASYTQTVTGILIAQLAGHTPPGQYGVPGTDYGQVSVAGDVKLAGSFQVHLLNGYVPSPGDQFLIINNQGPNPIDGIFADLPEGSIVSDGTHLFQVTYQGGPGNNDFVLTAVSLNSAPTASAGGPYAVVEGESLTLDATASSDPDGDSLTYTWDINSDGIFGDAIGLSPTLTWAQLQSLGIDDGPRTFHPTVRVDDGHGHSVDSAATTLTLSNTVPVAGLGDPSGGVTGQALTFLLSALDASLADLAAGFTYTINWHDGSPIQVISPTAGNGAGVSVSHTFATTGTYVVSINATDKDGGISSVVSRTVNIVAVQVQGNDLVIGGTPCDDQFAISTGSQPGKVKIRLNGSLLGDFLVTGSIVIFGGLGDDSTTITGTSATDDFAVFDSSIVFNAKNIVGDSICAWQVNAVGDNDSFSVYGGSALLKGGTGNDSFTIFGGAPTLDGGGGNDTFTVHGGAPTINSGSGNDTFSIFGGAPTIHSGSGNDAFTIHAGTPSIDSGSGNDTFTIYNGSVCVDSGSGDDTFVIYSGSHSIDSGSGDDVFTIYGGVYSLNTGTGNDSFTIYNGAGSIDASNGYDSFTIYAGATTIFAGAGNDSFRIYGGLAAIDGGDGNDSFALYGFAASILGGAGNDLFTVYDGANVLGLVDGGTGTNALDYSASTSEIYVNLTTGAATGTGSIANIRNVTGGQSNDILVGDDNDNSLTGMGGRNLIIGGRGKDTLRAGVGGDILIGGYTSFDANAAALNALFSTWNRTDLTYVQRVAALQTGVAYTDPSGTHQAALAASTVFDDAAVDALFGGAGADWFFARLTGSKKDTLNDLLGGETVTNI
jgi:Ca2+-binding RTX toxin-like protein